MASEGDIKQPHFSNKLIMNSIIENQRVSKAKTDKNYKIQNIMSGNEFRIGKTLIKTQVQKTEFEKKLISQYYLDIGNAYINHLKKENPDNSGRDIIPYQEALKIITPDNSPREYAMILINLGDIYSKMSVDNSTREKAIEYYNDALKYLIPERFPYEYARIMNSLGNLYIKPRTGDRRANLEKAIHSYGEALRFGGPLGLNCSYIDENFTYAYEGLFGSDARIDFQEIIRFLKNGEIFKIVKRSTKLEMPSRCGKDEPIAISIQLVIDDRISSNVKKLSEILFANEPKVIIVLNITYLTYHIRIWESMILQRKDSSSGQESYPSRFL